MHTLTKRLEVVVDEGKLTKKSSFGTANSPSLLAVQHYVHDDDNMSVSCRIEATAKCMKTLQLLGHEDTHGTTETSEQNQAVSDITTKASGREQVASDHDQNEIISSPAARDQNHENVCVVGVTGDQNNEKARDGSEDQDQNCEKNYGKNGHSKRTNEKQEKQIEGTNEKQMTYREALLGLDNSEPSSNF